MRSQLIAVAITFLLWSASAVPVNLFPHNIWVAAELQLPGKHHKKHHHHKAHADKTSGEAPVVASDGNTSAVNLVSDTVAKTARGDLEMNGPLPVDFSETFAREVAKATGCNASDVKVIRTSALEGHPETVDEVIFEAPPEVIAAVQEQAADPDSKLATGPLRMFLVEKADTAEAENAVEDMEIQAQQAKAQEQEQADDEKDMKDEQQESEAKKSKKSEKSNEDADDDDQKAKTTRSKDMQTEADDADQSESEETPVQEKGIDVDTSMPYGELEPFGREDTAQELTKGAIRESDEMVDQLERAEVAEEKRSVFRALTRLRGAAITSFDGVARAQTGNIDVYARTNHWRTSHPVRHLADEEGDVSKWAFPDNCQTDC